MYSLRDFVYRCKDKGHLVGKVNRPALQPEGWYIYTSPKRHINPDELRVFVLCLLDGLDYKIGASGEIWLKLPRNTKYGPLLNGIARAYYELQIGKREPASGQQTLTKEATSGE